MDEPETIKAMRGISTIGEKFGAIGVARGPQGNRKARRSRRSESMVLGAGCAPSFSSHHGNQGSSLRQGGCDDSNQPGVVGSFASAPMRQALDLAWFRLCDSRLKTGS